MHNKENDLGSAANPSSKLSWHRPKLRELEIAGKTASGDHTHYNTTEASWYHVMDPSS